MNDFSQLMQTCVGYGAFGLVTIALIVWLVRMHTQHGQQHRKNDELDARKRVRDRDGATADRAADDLIAIGEKRQAVAEAIAGWKLVLLGLALGLAFAAWRLSVNV